MEHGDWVWVCDCGAHILTGPEGRHKYDAINAHAHQHRAEVGKTTTGGWGFGPFPATIVPTSEFPTPFAYEMRWTNLQTGAVAPHPTFGVENPAYEALQWHGGTPYR
ncbi:MAG: hypothetical protein M0Z36_02145 [Thermaerobacter sp.]|nr:hypothetical protein [Thermaerobacter sp.]